MVYVCNFMMHFGSALALQATPGASKGTVGLGEDMNLENISRLAEGTVGPDAARHSDPPSSSSHDPTKGGEEVVTETSKNRICGRDGST